MKVKKLGHCCLLIEVNGRRILTDPGSYTVEEHTKLQDIDFILFTHEHQDHFHIDSLKKVLEKNPKAKVYANTSVSELLNNEGISYTTIKNLEEVSLGGVKVLGIGEKHALMHSSIPASSNTGFFIAERLFYPGDSFTNPEREIEILALPVSGPWMKIGEAIDFAFLVKPKVAFPVHDGTRFGSAHAFPAKMLPMKGIEFFPMIEGDEKEF